MESALARSKSRWTNAPSLAFPALEVELLAPTAAKADGSVLGADLSLQECWTRLARLGGYLNRSSDGPTGTTVMWRGMARLTEIAFDYEFAGGSCG